MSRSQRKDEHVVHALDQKYGPSDFERMQLFHQSLPDFDIDEIDLKTTFLGQTFNYPLYVNAMTGGSEKTTEINQKLARLAKRYGLPMAVGSQHAALDDCSLEKSYQVVREVYPDGFIIGNVNANASLEEAKRAVTMINANALGIHINPAQELTMDEGDRHFRHWKNNIETIINGLDIPVLVKEVGNGMSRETVASLINLGVKTIDVSGRGGTNFVWIENQRSDKKKYEYLENWGLTTLDSLLDVQNYRKKITLIASGGIRNPLDAIKALVLGANAVGMSAYMLRLVMEDKENELETFMDDMRKIMVLLNVRTIEDLQKVRYLIR